MPGSSSRLSALASIIALAGVGAGVGLVASACETPSPSDLDVRGQHGTSSSGGGSSGEPGGGDDEPIDVGRKVVDGGDVSREDAGDRTSPTTGADKPSCKYTAHETGLVTSQQAGGLSFTTYAPASYDQSIGHGVVFILHGQDSNGVPELEAFWKKIADDEGLVLVAPKGSRAATNGSSTGANWATGDLNHVLDLVEEIDDCYNVLTKKHLLWGFSEGGFYGYLLGIGAAEVFSGLAMGGANTSHARQNGYPPSKAAWKIPVSHVHGTQDFNGIEWTYQDRDDFIAAGHVFTLHEHPGGHTITAAQVRTQYDDLKASLSP